MHAASRTSGRRDAIITMHALASTAATRDRRLMVFAHVFALFAIAVCAALLLPETSMRPAFDRADYLLWASLACAIPALPSFLLRERHPAFLSYWRWSTTAALVAFIVHLGFAVAARQPGGLARTWAGTAPGWGWLADVLACWWIVDTFLAWLSPRGTTTPGSRLMRASLLAVVLVALSAPAWRSGQMVPRTLVVLAIVAIVVALGWRSLPRRSEA